jgi:hypothetical protein
LRKNAGAALDDITATGILNVAIQTGRFSANLNFEAATGILMAGSAMAYEGRIKVWTGAEWVLRSVKIWNGSEWVSKNGKVWNGSTWI